jgi:hypothetical protein
MTEEIRHLRLINGDEVIGKIVNRLEKSILVQNPYMVVETSTQVMLSKFVPFSENQTIELKNDHIIACTELHEEMVRYYRNSIMLGKSSSMMALEGLAKVNDAMEQYIYEGGTDDQTFSMPSKELTEKATHQSSNTVH